MVAITEHRARGRPDDRPHGAGDGRAHRESGHRSDVGLFGGLARNVFALIGIGRHYETAGHECHSERAGAET
jgi:hypothetical protein